MLKACLTSCCLQAQHPCCKAACAVGYISIEQVDNLFGRQAMKGDLGQPALDNFGMPCRTVLTSVHVPAESECLDDRCKGRQGWVLP